MLDLFKYLTIILAMVAALVNLTIDYKQKERSPRNRLAIWGIVCLTIIAGIIAFFIQRSELVSEKQKNYEQSAKAIEQTQEMNNLLIQVNRSLNPIKEVFLDVELVHPVDSLLEGYAKRITHTIGKNPSNYSPYYLSTNLMYNGYGDCFQFDKYSPLLPDKRTEPLAERALGYEYVIVGIKKDFDTQAFLAKRIADGGLTDAAPESDLIFESDLALHPKKRAGVSAIMTYSPAQQSLLLWNPNTQGDKQPDFRTTSTIKSTLDFPGSTLIITIGSDAGPYPGHGRHHTKSKLDYSIDEKFTQSLLKFEISFLRITIDQKKYIITGSQLQKLTDNVNGPIYTYTFPKKGNYSDDAHLDSLIAK